MSSATSDPTATTQADLGPLAPVTLNLDENLFSTTKNNFNSDVQSLVNNEKSETDAIHPRLQGLPSSDSVSDLASAALEKMNESETKKKKPPPKKKLSKPARADKKTTKTQTADKTDSNKPKTQIAETKREIHIPYLRVDGSSQNPISVAIINKAQMVDESRMFLCRRLKAAAKIIDSENMRKISGDNVFVSTMSEQYDTVHRDPSWFCVFCEKHSHADLLGDLYGPYYTKVDLVDLSTTVEEVSKTKRRRTLSGTGNVKRENGAECGVWFHENCLVWAPGVCFVPPCFLGLDDAIKKSRNHVCDDCNKKGAHIFCRHVGCQSRTHFPCAEAHGWILLEENFIALCPTHRGTPL